MRTRASMVGCQPLQELHNVIQTALIRKELVEVGEESEANGVVEVLVIFAIGVLAHAQAVREG